MFYKRKIRGKEKNCLFVYCLKHVESSFCENAILGRLIKNSDIQSRDLGQECTSTELWVELDRHLNIEPY